MSKEHASRVMQEADLYSLLRKPIVTEKTTAQAELGQYVFEVDTQANKVELTRAFNLAFPGRKVNAVRLIKVKAKLKRTGKKTGRIAARRKAIFSVVGDPIELFTNV